MLDKVQGRLISIARLRLLADALELDKAEFKHMRLTAWPLAGTEELLIEVKHKEVIPAMDVPKEEK